MTRALGAGALERAMDAAASLEVRGYGAGRRPALGERPPWSHDERAFALAGGLVAFLPVAMRLSGAGWFDPYPTLAADTHAAVLATALCLPALTAAPFVLAVRRRARRAVHPGRAHA
jgi:energy-coupling factor transport system permease protein